MGRWLLLLFLVPFVALPGEAAAGPVLDSVSALRVSPQSGHPGDIFYLSGSGLTPNVQLYLFMACPVWYASTVQQYGNEWYTPNGPKTDANGNFVAYPIRAIVLHHLPEGSNCTIYSTAGSRAPSNEAFGPDIPAIYHIYPAGVRLSRCDRQICGTVVARLKHARSGYMQSIYVTGWPGARVTLTVTYPAMAPITATVRLDYKGAGTYQMRVPAGAVKPAHAHVSAIFRMGRVQGHASTQFLVQH